MNDGTMPLTAHLEELRWRVVKSAVGVAIAFGGCYFFSDRIFEFLTNPLVALGDARLQLIGTGITEAFFTRLKVSFIAAIFAASPVIFYQAGASSSRALSTASADGACPSCSARRVLRERRAFCYVAVFPVGYAFFLEEYADIASRRRSASASTCRSRRACCWRSGDVRDAGRHLLPRARRRVDHRSLIGWLRYAIVVIFIVAAVLTPGPTLRRSCLMAGPLLVLYVLSIGVAFVFAARKRRPPTSAQPKPRSVTRTGAAMAESLTCIKVDDRQGRHAAVGLPDARTRSGAGPHALLDDLRQRHPHRRRDPDLAVGAPDGPRSGRRGRRRGDGVTSFARASGSSPPASSAAALRALPGGRAADLRALRRAHEPALRRAGGVLPGAERRAQHGQGAGRLERRGVLFATDIMSTGFGAIEAAALRYGDSVAIFAQGPVGLCVTAAARARGAGLIVAVESIPARVAMAKRLGADRVVEPAGAVEAILALTGGKGVDVAVEALGNQVTLEGAARVTRFGGTVSSVGVYSLFPTVALPTDGTFLHRRFVTTLCPSGADRLRRMMDVVRYGKVDLTPLFTHHLKLRDTPAGYDLFRSRREGVIKIALRP
jgi:Sec-independent protein secretion pathway component TatC